MKALLAMLLSCVLACTVSAATPPKHPAHEAPAPAVSPTVPLLEGLGPLHHPVSTKSFEAQRYFDQGLRLAWAFNHDEAFRAFQQAARLDTNLAMAQWGMASSPGPTSTFRWTGPARPPGNTFVACASRRRARE